MKLLFQKLEHIYKLPAYQSAGASGMDIYAASDEVLPVAITIAVPTGFAIAIPPGYEAQLRARSGLALRHNIVLPNAPGTIDSDYRGEVKILMLNLGSEKYHIRRGDRIAQMVIAPVIQAMPTAVKVLPTTDRGEGGFGSTGRQ